MGVNKDQQSIVPDERLIVPIEARVEKLLF